MKSSHDEEWFCIKLPMLAIWLIIMWVMTSNIENCLYPVGICKWVSFDLLFTTTGKIILWLVIAIVSIFYLLERHMILSTFLLSLVSVIVITFHESNGIFFRATILSLVWLAQLTAYLIKHFRHRFNLTVFRQQYVSQMIVAVYVLAGIAKIKASGWRWGLNTEGFALQVNKNYSFLLYDTGDITRFEFAGRIASFFAQNTTATCVMLTSALLLELFCVFALFSKVGRIFFGIGLLIMHIGIALFMGIGISVVCFPMAFFFLNPLYSLVKCIRYLKQSLFTTKIIFLN